MYRKAETVRFVRAQEVDVDNLGSVAPLSRFNESTWKVLIAIVFIHLLVGFVSCQEFKRKNQQEWQKDDSE
jgi:hypothetical protein